MNLSARMRVSLATVLAAACAQLPAPVAAQSTARDSIFTQVNPSLRDRMFMRLNYVHANVKTTSGEAYDVTGPVVGFNDIRNVLGVGTGRSALGVLRSSYRIIAGQLEDSLETAAEADDCARYLEGLGTPCGIRAKSQERVGTPAITAGFFLDDNYSWFVEAFVLAAPLKVEVKGDGAGSINDKALINLKLLPPTAVLGKYFGNKDSRIRPFVGVGASYAIFFDARATETLNRYQGGANAGDTSVSIKNVFGVGPFLGVKAQLDDDWHLSFSIGKLRYKTEATLVTRNTTITNDSEILRDYPPEVYNAILGAQDTVTSTTDPRFGTTLLMCDLALAKNGNTSCNQGTFVRKQSTKLDNTLFTFGVGRRF